MKKKVKPVSGYTLIETIFEGGTSLVTSSGEKVGATKVNVVVSVSPEDDLEWKVGDKVAVGDRVKEGYDFSEGDRKFVLIPNSAIIAVL